MGKVLNTDLLNTGINVGINRTNIEIQKDILAHVERELIFGYFFNGKSIEYRIVKCTK